MCGIAGIIYRDGDGTTIGRDMTAMLQSMKHRGPDSTGFALYRPPRRTATYAMRVKLADANDAARLRVPRPARAGTAAEVEAGCVARRRDGRRVRGQHRVRVQRRRSATTATSSARRPRGEHPGRRGAVDRALAARSSRTSATPRAWPAEYNLDRFVGSHAIGHVRMATESDVDISGAHPYWAYPFSDVAVVHNGQLTNYL